MAHIGLLGGSFNPPHVGHLMVALWAIATERVDELWFVPCHEHAFGKPLEEFVHREAMCRALVDLLPAGYASVSAIEGERAGPSRTYDTVVELRRRFANHRFSLIVGADVVAEMSSWYRVDDLRNEVGMIAIGRPGFGQPAGGVAFADISSTEVRRRLSVGEDSSALLPGSVLAYIRAHGCFNA